MKPREYDTKADYDAAWAKGRASKAKLTIGLLVLFAAFAVGVFIVAT